MVAGKQKKERGVRVPIAPTRAHPILANFLLLGPTFQIVTSQGPSLQNVGC
jgi:hypothetical protein